MSEIKTRQSHISLYEINRTSDSLWVDDFDDIDSDFDSRHDLKRRISEDFLHEMELSLAYHETKASEFVLLIPTKKRNLEIERHIVSSIGHFFQKQAGFHEELYRKAFRKGLTMLVAGIALMTINFVLNYHLTAVFCCPCYVYGLNVVL